VSLCPDRKEYGRCTRISFTRAKKTTKSAEVPNFFGVESAVIGASWYKIYKRREISDIALEV
jgi:hypothetical protein